MDHNIPRSGSVTNFFCLRQYSLFPNITQSLQFARRSDHAYKSCLRSLAVRGGAAAPRSSGSRRCRGTGGGRRSTGVPSPSPSLEVGGSCKRVDALGMDPQPVGSLSQLITSQQSTEGKQILKLPISSHATVSGQCMQVSQRTGFFSIRTHACV